MGFVWTLASISSATEDWHNLGSLIVNLHCGPVDPKGKLKKMPSVLSYNPGIPPSPLSVKNEVKHVENSERVSLTKKEAANRDEYQSRGEHAQMPWKQPCGTGMNSCCTIITTITTH